MRRESKGRDGDRDRDRDRDKDKETLKKKVFRKKACKLCIEKAPNLDYKELQRLQRFVSERGKIIPSRISGLCAKHQRQSKVAIKRARFIALLPYTAE